MIYAVNQTLLRERFDQSQVRCLAVGVHAGVGATRAVQSDGLAEQIRSSFFDDLLHAQSVVLSLPASVGRAAIGESQSVVHDESIFHSETRRSAKNGPQTAR